MADPFSAEQATFVLQSEDLAALKQWLTTVGLTKLERQLRVLGIERGSTEVAEVVSRQFVLQGSPNGSHDSLFLTAWKGARSQRRLGFSSRLSSSNESK
jgi:hypothetical protein